MRKKGRVKKRRRKRKVRKMVMLKWPRVHSHRYRQEVAEVLDRMVCDSSNLPFGRQPSNKY